MSRAILENLFLTYVRPIMEYACVVWSGAPTQLLSRLDNILVQGMRIATGAPARSNISSLYKETG